MKNSGQFENGIELIELDEGLLVRQYDDAYVAKKWRLNENTRNLVATALAAGLRWMIRDGHPQAHARWPSRSGRVYLAFSPSRQNQWSVAIDSVNARCDDYGKAVFNGKYRSQFDERGIHYEFEKRNRTAGHLVVDRDQVLTTLEELADCDHSVLYLGRSTNNRKGFGTEYDIQRSLLFNWQKTPFGAHARLCGDEVPVDSGTNPRRMDILALDCQTNQPIIIEVKRAEAHIDAIDQLLTYMGAMSSKPEFRELTPRGILIAERIPPSVNEKARSTNVQTYEIEFPFTLREIT